MYFDLLTKTADVFMQVQCLSANNVISVMSKPKVKTTRADLIV